LTRLKASDREYVKGVIHNLSFQRLTDMEIVQWLHEEKKIDLDRSTVSRLRNRVERQAERWYVELKRSSYRYIAIYKERIDSLFYYQKKLHEIIESTDRPEVRLRAISELHSIEMSIFNLWKQLPNLNITDPGEATTKPPEKERPYMVDDYDEFGHEERPTGLNSIGESEDDKTYFQCEGCKRWWRDQELLAYHRRNGKCLLSGLQD
jgi:hypothetical protein